MRVLDSLPPSVIAALLARATAAGVGALLARRQPPGTARAVAGLLCDATLVGLLAARLAFVARWWPQYVADPAAIIFISDGGFLPWVGAAAGVAFMLWRARPRPTLWRALSGAVATGWIVWFLAGALLTLGPDAHTTLPDATLARLDGTPMRLAELSNRPMVVNLWATWCPPCRREMPMLADAQHRLNDIHFVFVNQGQNPATIRSYLREEDLQLSNVLLDPHGEVARNIGSRALPTTLFFAADGRLVDTHFGMLTAAGLAATLQSHELTAVDTNTQSEMTRDH